MRLASSSSHTLRPRLGQWLAFAAASATTSGALSVRAAYRSDIAASRARVAKGGTIVETSVGPIEYAERGAGSPLLSIHGAGGGYDQGLWGFHSLGDVPLRSIAPSRFGYLGTPLPADATPAAQADAHAALLDVLGIERTAVMGSSAGALSAMQFAIRHPQRTSALVLHIPDAWAPPSSKSASNELMTSPFINNVVLKSDFIMWSFIKLDRADMIAFLGVPKRLQATMTQEQHARVDELMNLILPVSRRRRGIMNDAKNSKSLERYPLESIQAPTLVVDASDVSTFPKSMYTAEHVPDATLIVYESGGHLLVGHEQESAAAIAGFLVRHSH